MALVYGVIINFVLVLKNIFLFNLLYCILKYFFWAGDQTEFFLQIFFEEKKVFKSRQDWFRIKYITNLFLNMQ